MPLTSYAPLNLCVHKLDAKSPRPVSWPQFATDTIGALATPLPGCLIRGPYPFLCESSRSLLGELQAASPGHRTAPILKQDTSVLQTIDIILSAVVAARATHYFLQGGLNPRTPLFVSFVQSVLLAHTGDLILREHLAFVLPRYPYAGESSLFELLPRYSRATLTGFCSVETRKWSEEPDEVMEDLDAMSASTDHDKDSQSSRSRSLFPRFDSHIDEPPALDAEPSDHSDDIQPFHHWCDKHVFIDKDLNPDVACVLVMTEQRNIYHAISSALYHRRAIGIHEPIIGLTFGAHGSSLYLVLAWLGEDMTCSDQTLPVVHLVHAPFEAGGTASDGVFDMRDPIAALYLARVLHSLPQNLPCITAQAIHESKSSPMDIDMQLALSWRADQILPGIETDPSSHKVISAWVESMRVYNFPAAGEANHSLDSMSQRTKAGSQGRGSGSGAGKARSKVQSGLQSVFENQPADHTSVTTDETPPIAARNKNTKALSAFSMSIFAAASSSSEAGEVDHMTHWTLNRNVLRDSKAPPEIYESLAQDYGRETYVEYCKEYDSIVALGWPITWNTVQSLPQVEPGLKPLLLELHRQHAVRKNCPGRLPIQVITDPILIKLLEHRLQELLRVVQDAIRMKESSKQLKVPEAMARTGFDRLIRLFFDGEDETDRLSILEVPISMPRNTLADAVIGKQELDARAVTYRWGSKSPGTIQQHRKDLEDDAYLTMQLNAGARDPQLGLMAENAEAARDLVLRAVYNVQGNPDAVINRALWEPSTGTVDNLGLVRIKNFFDFENPYTTDDINDFAIFDIPGRKKKDLAAQSEVISTLQRLLGRPIRTNDSRDPFVSARHEYATEPAGLSQEMTSSETPSLSSARSPSVVEQEPPTQPTKQDELVNLSRDLFLSFFPAEYKKELEAFSIQGPNQVRSYMVATLKHLAACDVDEFLIFSLYSEGTVGVIQAGWEEKRDRQRNAPTKGGTHQARDPTKGGTHLLDRNCQAFDISNVLGAFNFAVFLAKLAHNHVPKLLKRFEEKKRLALLRKIREKDADLKWKYSHQMEEEAFTKAKDKAAKADAKRREQEIEAEKKKASTSETGS